MNALSAVDIANWALLVLVGVELIWFAALIRRHLARSNEFIAQVIEYELGPVRAETRTLGQLHPGDRVAGWTVRDVCLNPFGTEVTVGFTRGDDVATQRGGMDESIKLISHREDS